MDAYAEFTIEEVQELWQRKARRLQLTPNDVKLRFQVQHLQTIVSMRMVDRDLRAELVAARDEKPAEAVA